MRGILWILALFVLLSAGLTLLRAVTNNMLPPKSARDPKLVKDPICGRYVAEELAIQTRGNFFCSEECLHEWLHWNKH
jgi:YHS domain-containing protein